MCVCCLVNYGSMDAAKETDTPNPPAMGQGELLTRVKELQELACTAVAQDRAGQHKASISSYEQAVSGMRRTVELLPPDMQASFASQLEDYERRLACLRSNQNASRLRHRASRGPLDDGVTDLLPGLDRLSEQATSWEPEPDNTLRRPYWVLRLLRRTVTFGGYLTPRLYVPKNVWEQDGAKFAGLSSKVAAFEGVLRLLIDHVAPLEPPCDAFSVRRCLPTLAAVRTELDQLQNDLSKPFPFVREVVPPLSSSQLTPSSPSGGPGGKSPVPMQQRLSSLMFALGKSVTKSASTAYERLGAAVPGKISDSQLGSYSILVADVCDKCQMLDDWAVRLQHTRTTVQQRLRTAERSAHSVIEADVVLLTCIEELYGELHHIARFVQEVLVELLVRDVEGLVERYLRKLRKALVRLDWEDDTGTSDDL